MNDTVTLVAVGDISLGDHPVCVGHGVRSALEVDPQPFYSAIAPLLSPSDIVLGNLETVASDVGYRKGAIASFEMRGQRKALQLLTQVGFNVLGVANNHSLQHGPDAFADSVANVRSHGIEVAGLVDSNGDGKIVRVAVRDQMVNIAAISLRPEEWFHGRPLYWRREPGDALIREVQAIRKAIEGHLVVSVHWGLEFIDFPSESCVAIGRALVDAGVDVVIGHHPHVPQPYEKYRNGLILYSLGNFLFDLWTDDMRRGAIARLTLGKGSPPEVEIVPITSCPSHVPTRARGVEAQRILQIMDPARLHDVPLLPEDEYNALYRQRRLSFRRESHKYFLRNLHRYPRRFVFQALSRTLMRRLSGR